MQFLCCQLTNIHDIRFKWLELRLDYYTAFLSKNESLEFPYISEVSLFKTLIIEIQAKNPYEFLTAYS